MITSAVLALDTEPAYEYRTLAEWVEKYAIPAGQWFVREYPHDDYMVVAMGSHVFLRLRGLVMADSVYHISGRYRPVTVAVEMSRQPVKLERLPQLAPRKPKAKV